MALLRMGPQSQPSLGAPNIDWPPCLKRWMASYKNGLLLLFYPLMHPPNALSLPQPPADFKLWSASHNGIFQILLWVSTREMSSALCLSFPICEERVLGPTGAGLVYLEHASESLMPPWLGSEGRVLRGRGELASLMLWPHPDTVRPSLWSSPRTLSYFPLLVFLTRIPHTWTKPSCYPGGHQ